jgi:hypothetical protein
MCGERERLASMHVHAHWVGKSDGLEAFMYTHISVMKCRIGGAG